MIGDSHSIFFSKAESASPESGFFKEKQINMYKDESNQFRIFHLGPVLAYSLSRYNTTTRGREKVEYLIKSGVIQKGSPVICCFGEIDIRVHILRIAEQRGCTIDSVIDEMIVHYLSFLDYLNIQNEPIVWAPIASQKDGSEIDSAYPYYGSEEIRNRITERLVLRLGGECKKHHVKLMCVFYDLIDKDYRTNSIYYKDVCHLSQRAWGFAKRELEKTGLL